jgi:hypothetical protein
MNEEQRSDPFDDTQYRKGIEQEIRHLVFLLEEPSAAELLKGVMRRLAGNITVHYLIFQGKQDLEKQLVRKLRGWLLPNSHFLVMRDQDAGDCMAIKGRLSNLCADAGKPNYTIRIACRELEAFFLGDWDAVAAAFGRPELAGNARKAKYRYPDMIVRPSVELGKIILDYQKCDGAARIAPLLNLENSRSRSFSVLISELKRLSASS